MKIMLRFSQPAELGPPVSPARLAVFIERMRDVREGEARLAMLLQEEDAPPSGHDMDDRISLRSGNGAPYLIWP